MIKAIARREDGDELLILGLSKGNIEKLKENLPICFKKQDLKGCKYDVLIVYGDTEEAIVNELNNQFYIEEKNIKYEGLIN